MVKLHDSQTKTGDFTPRFLVESHESQESWGRSTCSWPPSCNWFTLSLYLYYICIYTAYIYIYMCVLFSDWTLREGDGEREKERERDVWCMYYLYLFMCSIYIYTMQDLFLCMCVCMYCSIICFRLHKHTHTALVAQMDIVYIPFQWHFKPSNTIATDKYSIFFEIDQWTRHCTQRSNSCNDICIWICGVVLLVSMRSRN
jgi:hypothetical protein